MRAEFVGVMDGFSSGRHTSTLLGRSLITSSQSGASDLTGSSSGSVLTGLETTIRHADRLYRSDAKCFIMHFCSEMISILDSDDSLRSYDAKVIIIIIIIIQWVFSFLKKKSALWGVPI